MVLPVDYRSVATLDMIQTQIPRETTLCLPPSESLKISLNKTKTLAVAKRIGLQVPEDYTAFVSGVDSLGRRPEDLEQLPFPMFLKAAQEAERRVAAKVDSPLGFWSTYDRLRAESEDGTVLVQEFVNGGDGHNYCHGLLFIEDRVELSFGHEKVTSVPRESGSAARVRVLRDPHLEAMSVELLRELKWNGVGLVEYKKRADGTYVLLEINARIWGAYALASKSGYHFHSTMVARTLNLPVKSPPALPRAGEMAFPLREITFWLENLRDESLLTSIAVIAWPPCRWDLDFRDLRAWLPAGGLRRLVKRPWELWKGHET
jgi:predicted ATP-grasp superfamily ATP-dependent carboligase